MNITSLRRPLEISILKAMYMPYCRECGKSVEENWVTCPFCSKTIGQPASLNVGISDSVVMGDITTINDSDSISSAVQTASKCTSCGSIGTTLLACLVCKKIAHCSICKDEIYNKRLNSFVLATGHALPGQSILQSRTCHDCFSVERDSRKYTRCILCKLYVIPLVKPGREKPEDPYLCLICEDNL